MIKAEKTIKESAELKAHRVKLIERECPRCDSIIMKNEKEDCYECIKCGYIDCGTQKN